MNLKLKFRLIIIFFIFLLNLFFIFLYLSQQPQDFEVAFIDVAQGHSTIIKTQNHKQIIIDSGRGTHALKHISRYLGFFNRRFDIALLLIMTPITLNYSHFLSIIIKSVRFLNHQFIMIILYGQI